MVLMNLFFNKFDVLLVFSLVSILMAPACSNAVYLIHLCCLLCFVLMFLSRRALCA